MSILIKGMEMPTRCYTCPCADLEFHDCNLIPGTRIEQHKRLDDCPLVPVPPHGRLSDADALIVDLMDRGIEGIQTDDWHEIQQAVADAPTIVPAEEGDT